MGKRSFGGAVAGLMRSIFGGVTQGGLYKRGSSACIPRILRMVPSGVRKAVNKNAEEPRIYKNRHQ
jgi:hypothetical protein